MTNEQKLQVFMIMMDLTSRKNKSKKDILDITFTKCRNIIFDSEGRMKLGTSVLYDYADTIYKALFEL